MSDTKQPIDTSRELDVADLLAAGDLQPLPIQELGGHVYLRQLSARTVLDFVEKNKDPKNPNRQSVVSLIAEAVVNSRGERLFTKDTADKLADARISVFSALSKAVTEMASAITGDSEGKDSTEATSSSSPTD